MKKIASNFNVANPSHGFGYPCWRYDKANELPGQLINKGELMSFNDVTNVMDAIYQESNIWTIETMVADLVNGVLYLYYFYQYENPVIINIKDELVCYNFCRQSDWRIIHIFIRVQGSKVRLSGMECLCRKSRGSDHIKVEQNLVVDTYQHFNSYGRTNFRDYSA